MTVTAIRVGTFQTHVHSLITCGTFLEDIRAQLTVTPIDDNDK